MKGRGLVVVLALVLATLATAGVFLYARGVKEEAKTGGTLVPVVVSKVDIAANSDLNALIDDKSFKVLEVPKNAVVAGAVTSVDQLRDKRNSVAILAGEQIPLARIGGEATLPGGALGIPEGYEAINVSLDGPRALAGAISAGDHVTIYATFTDFETLTGQQVPTATAVLVPDVQVLRVYLPLSEGSVPGAQQTQQVVGQVSVTLALTPEDSQHFVFAVETGRVWLGLLPPDEKGKPRKPVSYAQVVK